MLIAYERSSLSVLDLTRLYLLEFYAAFRTGVENVRVILCSVTTGLHEYEMASEKEKQQGFTDAVNGLYRITE
jgi:hypothetical protein